jgi:hypothetical protein
MAIHFDFVVEDTEAEFIFDALQNEIVKNMVHILDAMASGDANKEQWLRNHCDYLKKIKTKMLNYRVQSS